MRYYVVICFLSLTLTACVSVQLPGSKISPAKGVEYQIPPSPFKEIDAAQIDKSWQSTKSGNTISFFSSCSTTSDPSLETLEQDALNALGEIQDQNSEELNFNERAARQSSAKGKIDGIAVQLLVLVFKRNGCSYTLTYGGLEKNFSAEIEAFDRFKKSFRAP